MRTRSINSPARFTARSGAFAIFWGNGLAARDRGVAAARHGASAPPAGASMPRGGASLARRDPRVSRRAPRVALPLALAIAASGAASLCALAQERHWIAGSGVWSAPANWAPQDVPDSAVEHAVIDAPGAYAVEYDLAAGLGALTLTNPAGVVAMNYGTRLSMAGAIVNASTLTVNRTGGTPETWLQLLGDVACTGAGSIILNAHPSVPNSAGIGWYAGGETLTNGVGHTIRGTGAIHTFLTNHGTIAADRDGRALQLLAQPKANHALFVASGGGRLEVAAPVTQAPGAEIVADAGFVDLYATTITGGLVTSRNGGTVRVQGAPVLASVEAAGVVEVLAGRTLGVAGSLANDAVITVNPGASTPDTVYRALTSHAITGTGSIVLNAHPGNPNSAAIGWYAGTEEIANGAGHTIRGAGGIYPALVNHGTILADQPGRTLQLLGQAKSNDALLGATNSGVLLISATISQGDVGRITGDAGRVDLGASAITGGTLATANAGLIQVVGGATLADVSLEGTLHVPYANTLQVAGSLENGGSIVLNPTAGSSDTVLRLIADLSLGGTGEVVLTAHPGNVNSAAIGWYAGNEALTNGAAHTIRGRGAIHVAMTNLGTILADTPSRDLSLIGQAKANPGTMRAASGGVLVVATSVSGPGQIIADVGSEVRFAGGTTSGAAIASIGDGLVTTAGAPALVDCSLAGRLHVPYASRLVLTGTLTNNGTVTINPTAGSPDTFAQLVGDTTLAGTGTLVLNAHPGNINAAAIAWYGGGEALTHGPGHTIAGHGAIYPALVNHGTLSPGWSDDDGLLHLPGARALTLTTSSRLEFDLFGATRHDRVVSTGPVALDGTIAVRLAPGFDAGHGVVFTLVQAPAITGAFAHEDLPGRTRLMRSATAVTLLDPCVADYDDGSSTGTPDGGTTIDDLLYYLQLLYAGDVLADVDDGSFTGTPDEGVTIDDLLYYLHRFGLGC